MEGSRPPVPLTPISRLRQATPPPPRLAGSRRRHHDGRQQSSCANNSTFMEEAVPAVVFQIVAALIMLFSVAAAVLAVVSIVLPRLYNIESTRSIALPSAEVVSESYNGTAIVDDVVLLPDFIGYIGMTLVCYGGDWNCVSRDERTFRPIPTRTIAYLAENILTENVTRALMDLTDGGPLDASLKRGEDACGSNSGRAINYRNLLLLCVCVAAVVSFLVLIPTTILQARWIETGRVVNAVRSVNRDFLNDNRNRLHIERACGGREIFWVMLPMLLSLLCSAAMIASVIFLTLLENELYCGHNACSDITAGLRAFAVRWLGSTEGHSYSCERGAATYALWVALIMDCCAFLCALTQVILFHCGKRRSFLAFVQGRIKLLQEQEPLTVAPSAEATASRGASRSPSTRPLSPLENGRISPLRVPPSPPNSTPSGRRVGPLRSPSVQHAHRNSEGRASVQQEWVSILSDREDLLLRGESISRNEIIALENISFVGSFGLIKRKVWRVERAVCLHDWCLDWYYGPLLDLFVEETFRRQEHIRKWLEKLLDRCTRFPHTEGNEPLACRLVPVDEALSWASPYPVDDGASNTHDRPFSPISRLRGLPFFEDQWRRIMDSPTSRFYDPAYGQKGAGGSSSVEVSSASDDDDSPRRHHQSLLRQRQTPPKGAVGQVPDRYGSLVASRELYPALYSPRQTPHAGSRQQASLDFRAITRATDDLRKAYEHAVQRSSSRPAFDRGVNASRDAAMDYQNAIERSQSSLGTNPPVGGPSAGFGPQRRVIPPPTTDVHWDAKPDVSWGEAAVAQRLAELSKYKKAADETNASFLDGDDLR